MDYETGTLLNELNRAENEATVERALIIGILERAYPTHYKAALEELRKQTKE